MDHGSPGLGQLESSGVGWGNAQDLDAQGGPADATVLDQVVHDVLRQTDRDGEAVALVIAGRALDRRVDTDDRAPRVDQGASGIPGVDHRVGLDQVFDRVVTVTGRPAYDPQGAAFSADDPRGDRERQRRRELSPRVADGEHELADGKPLRVAQRHRGQVLTRDLQDRDVGCRVPADQLGGILPTIEQLDRDLFGVSDHVVVRQNVAVRRDDEAGAAPERHVEGGVLGLGMERPEKLLEALRQAHAAGRPARVDGNHGRCDGLGYGYERGADLGQRFEGAACDGRRFAGYRSGG